MNQKTKFNQLKKKLFDSGVEFIDLKSLDLRGKLHSLILPAKMFDEDLIKFGVGFDASSMGFSDPEKSDMVMSPDLDTMFVDPFREKKTAVFFANIFLVDVRRIRFGNDVRFIAEKTEKVIRESRIATSALLSPEFEFFLFKNAEFEVNENGSFYYLEKDSEKKENFYHCSSPEDEYVDFRNEAVSIIQDLGIEIKYHHHEVAVNQHEIETKFDTLLNTADASVIIKYVIFNLAKKYDLFATFMPKPIHGKPGNGWHVHQYLTKGNKNIFFKSGKYGNLSREGLSYVSGILFHAGSLCALTNPSTNSYKRLVEGFEAPNEVIFAKSNRIGAIRIPAYTKEEETRIEYRVGDASSNPYLSLSSMILAGIDGIKKNLDPEKFYFGPFDSGIRSSKMLSKKVKKLPRDLAEALSNLEKDYDYLKADEVFSDDLVSQWIKIKREEIDEVMEVPYPKEFEQYFYF